MQKNLFLLFFLLFSFVSAGISFAEDVDMELKCPTSVTAGTAISATVKLTNYDCMQSVSVSRFYTALAGNSSNHTLAGAGLWGPFPKNLPAAKTVPAHIWLAVTKAGWQIRMAEFVVDAEPTLIHDRPRGWPDDMTWQNTDAIHFPQERLLVLAEKRRNRKGQIVAASRVAGVLRHELGHAFDMAADGGQGFRSAAPAFQSAYLADMKRMSPDGAEKLAQVFFRC